MKIRRTWAATIALALGLGAGVGVLPAAGADAPDVDPLTQGLTAWYKLDETSGTVAADSSGNGRNAAVEGTASWNGGAGFTFSGGAASAGNAIKLPNNIITGHESITVSADVLVDPSLTAAHFVYNLGNLAVGNPASGTGYLFTTTIPYRATISTKWWASEYRATTTTNLTKAVWKHLTYTQTGTVGTLFEDGVQVAQNTEVAVAPSAIGAGVTTRNYIGKSAYAADASFKGKVRDFRIYDHALESADVATLATQAAAADVASDVAAITLGDTSAVVANLTLPAKGAGGSAITWTTSDAAHVSTSGVVVRPTQGQPAATVDLVATATLRGQATTRTFTVTVPAVGDIPVTAVAVTPSSLTIGAGTSRALTASVSPAAASSVITWTSSNPAVATVSPTGLVTALSVGDTVVTAQTATPAIKQLIPVTVPADIPAGQILRYPFTSASGTGAVDASGHGADGALAGGAKLSADGVVLDGTDDHVTLPNNLTAGLDAITVDFDVWIDSTQVAPYFMFNLGNTATWPNGTGYMFVTGADTSARFRGTVTAGGGQTEESALRAGGLTTGAWKHVTYTLAGGTAALPGTAVLYEDGVAVATNSAITVKPSDLGAGVTTANFIGRSAYSGDKYFKGKIREFQIFNRALTPEEVATQAAPVAEGGVTLDLNDLTLGDTSAVISDLTLSTVGTHGSAIAWSSSDPATIAADGTVVRPLFGEDDVTVELTATLTKGTARATKTFTVTVVADVSDSDKAALDLEDLTVVNLTDVRGNITLPAAGARGSSVTWSSSSTRISATGIVTRPAYGSDDAEVVLTATATVAGQTATRDFTATVRALPRAVDDQGYVFSYFTGNSVAGEKIYFAASKGNNALQWSQLNSGAPKLDSTYGTLGLRDPFLIRSPEGDKFYLIATDLSIGRNGDWGYSQQHGSQYLEVWESTDLVNWSEQRHVKVSPDTAGNTWAPEAYYDESIGEYVVFWASKLYAEDDVNHTGSTYNRMLYATTRDFVTFSETTVWQDPGKSVIDSTVLKDGDTYYRFTKDEGSASGCTDIIQEKSTNLRAFSPSGDWTKVTDCIGKKAGTAAVEGPTIFKANPGDVNGEGFFLFVDEYGGRGYVPLMSASLETPSWKMPASSALPTSPRHGTVAGITKAQWNTLTGAAAETVGSTTALTLGAASIVVGTTTTAKAVVTAADGGQVGGKVTFTAGEWTETAALVDGTAQVDLPSSLAIGSVEVTASYLGFGEITASSDEASLDVLVDTQAPQVTAEVDASAPAGLAGWWLDEVTVRVEATDNTSVTSVEVSVDGGVWRSFEGAQGSVLVAGDGVHVVRARATDSSGNISEVVDREVRVDSSAPVSQAQTDKAARTVSLRAADEWSGVDRIEWRTGSGDWSTYAAPVVVGSGAVTVEYRAVDRAGNVEEVNSVDVLKAGVTLKASAVAATVAGSTYAFGSAATVRVTVVGAAGTPTGVVRVMDGSRQVASGTLSGGRVNVVLPKTLAVGSKTLSVVYVGDAAFAGSSGSVKVTVVKASSTTGVKLSASKVKTTVNAQAAVTVKSGAGVSVAGPVSVTITKKVSGVTKTVWTKATKVSSTGAVSVKLPKLSAGSYSVRVAYAGSSTVVASSVTTTLTVVK